MRTGSPDDVRTTRSAKVVQLAAWIAPLFAALCSGLLWRHRGALDGGFFEAAGRTMLSGHWPRTFGDPTLQAGPLELLLYGGAGRLADALSEPSTAVFGLLMHLLITAAALAATGSVVRGRRRAALAQAAVGLFVAAGFAGRVYVDGHPADVLIPLCWVVAACAAERDRPALAGSLLGCSAGLEVWGVLGVPVLLLVRGRRRLVVGLATAGAVVAALFVPFVVAGPFRMFEFHWVVSSRSLLRAVLRPTTPFPWSWRLLQGAAALAAGSAVALVARSSRLRAGGAVPGTTAWRPSVAWAVPAAVILVRLLLDPVGFAYYWDALEMLGLIAAADVATGLMEGRGSRLRGAVPTLRAAHGA